MRKILAILLLSTILFAKSDKPSDIPPASEIYINLEPFKCNDTCLLQLIKTDMLHSFLARFEGSSNQEIIQLFSALNGVAASFSPSGAELKIALIIPNESIKNYANIVSNAVISYLIRQNANIDVKFYNIGNESPAAIDSALMRVKNDGVSYLVAPFTQIGAAYLNSVLEPSMLAFIPTLHVSSVANLNPNLIFGGIDYKEQISRLLELANDQVAAFSDGSTLGNTLNLYADELSGGLAYETELKGQQTDLKPYISGNSRLNDANILLNVPLVKASLISSQLRLYDVKFNALLSTQINYSPSIFKLTQPSDRAKLYIANSLSEVDAGLDSNNEILGQNLKFNWVGYSTSVGLDYIYKTYLNQNANRLFAERVEDSQVIYDTKIMRADEFKFYE